MGCRWNYYTCGRAQILGPVIQYKPVKVQNVRARFRSESLDYDGVTTNTMGYQIP